MKKMAYVRDEDAHWFLIPFELKDKFDKMLQEAEANEDYDDFCSEFDQYRSSSPCGVAVFVE